MSVAGFNMTAVSCAVFDMLLERAGPRHFDKRRNAVAGGETDQAEYALHPIRADGDDTCCTQESSPRGRTWCAFVDSDWAGCRRSL